MIVAGFGFRAGATPGSLSDALARTGVAPDALATVADKAATPAFVDFADGRPVRSIAPAALTRIATATESAPSRAARGTGSVAEAAALAAAGPGARLLMPRTVSGDRMATCAIAEGTDP